jgi:hypothetical protein
MKAKQPKQSLPIIEPIFLDKLKEILAENKRTEENKLFNHFVETGEVLPNLDHDKKFILDSLSAITSLVRPGPLSDLNLPKPQPKRKKS